MKFNPLNILPQEQLDSLLNKKTGIVLGEMMKMPDDQVNNVMKEWTSRVDSMITRVSDDSPLQKLYINERGFTYEEYLILFKNISEEKYHIYPVFRSLMIMDKDFLIDFTTHYDDTFLGYTKALNFCFDVRKATALSVLFSNLKYICPISELKRHTYICGSTGSGKSQLMRLMFYWLHSLSNKDNSMSLVLIDPDGDLSREIKSSHLNIENPERFIFIDPELKEGSSPVINPLEIQFKSHNDVVNHAQSLSIAIENVVGVEHSKNISAVLVPCLSTLIRRPGSTFMDLMRFMKDDPELINEGLQSSFEPHRIFFEDFVKSHKLQKQAILSRFQSFLNFPPFHYLINGKSTIDLNGEVNNGKVIIFKLSQRSFGESGASAVGRFMIAMIKSIAFQRDQNRLPTFLFIDECQNFVSQALVKTLRQARKYGLHLILANQSTDDLGMIKDSVLGNTSVKFIGSVQSSDTLSTLSSATGASTEKLSGLRDFNFFVKTRDSDGRVFKPYDILIKDKSYSMDNEDEENIDDFLLETYYVENGSQDLSYASNKNRYEI